MNDEVAGPLPPVWLDAFKRALGERGWLESRNVVIETRSAKTLDERPRIVSEVSALKPEIIVATAPAAFMVSPNPTSPPSPGWTPVNVVPIVFLAVSDPVAARMVTSRSHPGGTMTGLSLLSREMNAKRLELLKEAVPSLTRVVVLVSATHPFRERLAQEI